VKKQLLITFFIISSSVVSLAQGYVYFISGDVRSSKDGDILVGATIEIKERNRQLRTDRTGYHISLPVGKYTVKVSYVGHKTKTDSIIVLKKADQVFNFSLDQEGIDLDEVRVTEHGQDANVGSTNVGLTRLNIKAIKKIPALLGEVDVVRSLLLLPGVTTVGEGATGFNVRGGSIDQNLVLMDDAPIYNASHLMGLLSVFN
jgi:ferric enterobactin receptor